MNAIIEHEGYALTVSKDGKKIVVVGIDGGTFDVILPLIEKGQLLNIKRFLVEGCWGNLQSTIPPSSGPAWSSFMTGKRPCNHGIFDFVNKRANSYEIYYINSTNIKGPTFWDILGQHGGKVGIINVMVTYPPRPVNGFLITGGLTPPGRTFTYPKQLAKEIEDLFGDYPSLPPGGISATEGREEEFVKVFLSNAKKRATIAKYLMENKEWAFFMVMFEGADSLQHELWKYIDQGHPQYVGNPKGYIIKAIPRFYQIVDRYVGYVLEKMSGEDTVCIMSDHGFRSLHRYFLVNNFLLKIGVLKLKSNLGTTLKRRVLSKVSPLDLYKLARKMGFNSAISKFRGGWSEELLSSLTLSRKSIDWKNTRAFAAGTGGHIYLNVKGREPLGMVEPGREYEKVKGFITEKLKSLVDEAGGGQPIARVYDKRTLHRGKFEDRAPDLSFLLQEGYATLHREQFVSSDVFINSPHSGTHDLEGIVMFLGSQIKKGERIRDAKIFDLAPTYLHLFGLPIPEDMDGQVLTNIFREDSDARKRKIAKERMGEKTMLKIIIKELKSKRKL